MILPAHPHLSEFKTNASAAANAFGTSVSSAGSAHTYGSWTQIHAGTTYPVEYFVVCLTNNYTATTTQNAYVDIGVGTSSSTVMPIAEKLCGSHAAAGIGRMYYLPVRIPQGQAIWARHQNTVASKAISVMISMFAGNQNPGSLPAATQLVALGATTASTTGTAITIASAPSEGAWTQIVASTTEDYAGFLISGQFTVDTTMTNGTVHTFDIGVGASGQEYSIGENITMSNVTNTDERVNSWSVPTYIGIPAGSRIVVRGSAVTAPDSSNSVIVLAMKH